MKKPLLLIGTHAVCVVAGLGVMRLAQDRKALGQGGTADSKRGPRQAEEMRAGNARELADRALAATRAGFFTPEAAELAAKEFTTPGEAGKRVREMTGDGSIQPAADAEFAGAWIAWFREDREAALAFLAKTEKSGIYDAVLQHVINSVSMEDAFALVKGTKGQPIGTRIGEALGARLSGMATTEAAAALRDHGAVGDKYLSSLLSMGWPADNPSGFLDLALASDDPVMVASYLMGSPRKASALLMLMEKREDLPKEFSDVFTEQRELIGHLYRYADPSVPLEERIAQMRNLSFLRDATPEGLRDMALKQISTVDINELMKTGPDYRYAFRQGVMSADEVLAAVKQQLPELAAANEYETRVRVFNELASEDPTAAYALLAGLPKETRDLAVLHQARWSFRDNSPDAFYGIINLFPGPDDAGSAAPRADAWSNYGENAYQEYGGDYIDWVRGLPDGVNRDAARKALAKTLIENEQADLAKEFQ